MIQACLWRPPAGRFAAASRAAPSTQVNPANEGKETATIHQQAVGLVLLVFCSLMDAVPDNSDT